MCVRFLTHFEDFPAIFKINGYISIFFLKEHFVDFFGLFFKPLVPPKKYFQTEFEAHTLQFRSTHEYFETAKYELQTPTTNMFLPHTWFWVLFFIIGLPLYLWSCTASKKEIVLIKIFIKPLYSILYFLFSLLFKTLVQKNKRKTVSRRSKRIEPMISSQDKGTTNIRSKPKQKPRQTSLNLETSNGYMLPAVELLNPPTVGMGGPSDDMLDSNSRMLENVLDDFGIRGDIATALTGPVVTRYDLNPSPGRTFDSIPCLVPTNVISIVISFLLSAFASATPGNKCPPVPPPAITTFRFIIRRSILDRFF